MQAEKYEQAYTQTETLRAYPFTMKKNLKGGMESLAVIRGKHAPGRPSATRLLCLGLLPLALLNGHLESEVVSPAQTLLLSSTQHTGP